MERREGVVSFKGSPATLIGRELKVGDKAPEFTLTAGDLSPVTLADSAGKTRVLITVPSLDTPTCATETKTFNQRMSDLGDDVVVYVISKDLPFAQGRFCGAEGIENIKTLSAYKDNKFAEAYGVLWEGPELLARAIFIISPDDTISYVQFVSEISEEPDYSAVLDALKAAV